MGAKVFETFSTVNAIARAAKFPALLVCHMNMAGPTSRSSAPPNHSRIEGGTTLAQNALLVTAIYRPDPKRTDRLCVINTGRNTGGPPISTFIRIRQRAGNYVYTGLPAPHLATPAAVIRHFFPAGDAEAAREWVRVVDMEAYAEANELWDVNAQAIVQEIERGPFWGRGSDLTFPWRPHIRLPVRVTLAGEDLAPPPTKRSKRALVPYI